MPMCEGTCRDFPFACSVLGGRGYKFKKEGTILNINLNKLKLFLNL
jgi:hypothetical protein